MTGHASLPEIVSWREPELPEALDPLIREGLEAGIEWAGWLAPAWAERPFTAPGEALLLAWRGGAIDAMASITEDPFTPVPDTGRLRFIYVRAAARRRGLANRLVQACLDVARPRWNRLRLHTDNPEAARIYARYGFRPAPPGEERTTHIACLGAP